MRGEETARLAFIAAVNAGSELDVAVDRVRRRGRMLSRIMAAKVIAVVAVGIGAGSVAVAATTDAFYEGPSAGQHSEPAGTDRPSVVDPASGPQPRTSAEPWKPTTAPAEPGESDSRSTPCRDRAEDGCGTSSTTVPPNTPSRPRTAPLGIAPEGTTGDAAAPGDIPPFGPNPSESVTPTAHAPHDISTKKQPPGQLKQTEPTTKKPKPEEADEG